MTKDEVLSRAWIECDPNRAGSEPGSGFHPDDVVDSEPVWHWFKPRAEALEEFIDRHGFKIVPVE